VDASAHGPRNRTARRVEGFRRYIKTAAVAQAEPAQHRRRQPGFPQRQAFGDAGHPQPRRPVVQRRAGGFGAAVPETVRFHHGHHLSAGAGGEEPGVGRDRKQVNGEYGALRAVAVSCGRRRSGRAHPATRSLATGPYSAAGAPVMSVQYRSP
jgi:hypothetical protein